MDRLGAIRVLIRVVDEGSLSEAARQLGMPLSTVSRQVSALESSLGARLLSRSTRRLAMTDAGRDYVMTCRRILEDMDNAERTVSGEYSSPRGELFISSPVVFGRLHLLPLIIQFLQQYPDIDVRLVQSDRVVDLLDEHVDVALRIGELPDSDLVAVPVGTLRRVVCGSPEYLSRYGTPNVLADLASHTCIVHEVKISSGNWSFDNWPRLDSTSLRTRLRINQVEAAIDAAEQGFGLVRVMRYQVAQAIQSSRLHEVLEDAEPPPLPINLVYPSQGVLPLKLRAFLDFARPRLRRLSTDGLLE